MPKTQYSSDKTNALEEVQGSDGRLNVSSRSDGRGYYNSRDESECFSLVFDDANATAADYVVYLRNDKTDGKHLIIQYIDIGCESTTSVLKLATVTGTAGGGTAVTPANLNQGGVAKTATVTALATADSGSTPMSGLTEDKLIDIVGISGAYGHEEFKLFDQLRLGQGQAIAIELDAAAAADVRVFGTIFFYFE
jgi:hypothetical protein